MSDWRTGHTGGPWLRPSAGAIRTDARTYATNYFRRAAQHPALYAAQRAPFDRLREDWLEEAYEAERDGNVKRARYLVGWAGRLPR